MYISTHDNRASLSVKELASFSADAPIPFIQSGQNWRTEAGKHWHECLQEQKKETSKHTLLCEKSIAYTQRHDRWIIEVKGRMDLVEITDEKISIEEIKSTQQVLPAERDVLEKAYPHYFKQAAIYAWLWRKQNPEQPVPKSKLVFVNISSGIQQEVEISYTESQEMATRQWHLLTQFLEMRQEARCCLDQINTLPPFEAWRPGQKELQEELRTAESQTSPFLLVEAPTGFGKTGILLDYALQKLKSGQVDRLIFLSSKKTGQQAFIKQLKAMLPPDAGINYLQIFSQEEHYQNRNIPDSTSKRYFQKSFPLTYQDLADAFRDNTLSFRQIQDMAQEWDTCPYTLSCMALAHAEIWIADYNYIFSQRSQHVFKAIPDYIPHRSLLLIDEAHNLPQRCTANHSLVINAHEWNKSILDLQFDDIPPEIIQQTEELIYLIHKLPLSHDLPHEELIPLLQLIKEIHQAFQGLPRDLSELSSESLNLRYQLSECHERLNQSDLDLLRCIEKPGILDIHCLDASREIHKACRAFAQSIFMSATFGPQDLFIQSCGIAPENTRHINAHYPQRSDQYNIAVDTRINTSHRTRRQHYPQTAKTIADLYQKTQNTFAVYFPSYFYARAIAQCIDTQGLDIPVRIQPRGAHLQAQQDFIKETQNEGSILFLIMGSSFSESIDELGDFIDTAIIVGPSLPEVNAAQKARMAIRASLPRNEAFQQVYQVPGMIKVNQAIGRLIRNPSHHANILLHCKRFAEKSYKALLSPELQTHTTIRNHEDLDAWMDGLNASH